MNRHIRLLAQIAAMTFLLPLHLTAQAQNSASTLPRPSPGKQATLLIDTDEDCTVSVDGNSNGTFLTDKSKTIQVAQGEHIVRASAIAAPDVIWRKVVQTKTGEQTAVLIELKPLVRGRSLAIGDEMKAAARKSLPALNSGAGAEKLESKGQSPTRLPTQGTFFAQQQLAHHPTKVDETRKESLSFTLKLSGNDGTAVRATILMIDDDWRESPELLAKFKETSEYKLLLQPSEADKIYRTVSCQVVVSDTSLGVTLPSTHSFPPRVCESGSGFETFTVMDELHIGTKVLRVLDGDKVLLSVTFVKSF